MSERLDAFRAAYLQSVDRFNAHDFEQAFAGLPEDVEWHVQSEWADLELTGTLHGREMLITAYTALISDFPDWHFEADEFIEVGPRTFAVRATATASGRASGVRLDQSATQVWELDAAGRAVRVREFRDHDEALAAARLTAGDQAQPSQN